MATVAEKEKKKTKKEKDIQDNDILYAIFSVSIHHIDDHFTKTSLKWINPA